MTARSTGESRSSSLYWCTTRLLLQILYASRPCDSRQCESGSEETGWRPTCGGQIGCQRGGVDGRDPSSGLHRKYVARGGRCCAKGVEGADGRRCEGAVSNWSTVQSVCQTRLIILANPISEKRQSGYCVARRRMREISRRIVSTPSKRWRMSATNDGTVKYECLRAV